MSLSANRRTGMPNTSNGVSRIEDVLRDLKDHTQKFQARCDFYQTAVKIIAEKSQAINPNIVNQLLSICTKDLKENMHYDAVVMNVLYVILQDYSTQDYKGSVDFLAPALAVLNVLKTRVLVSNIKSQQLLCLKTFLLFPDETFITLATDHAAEFLELFSLYVQAGIPHVVRYEPFNLLHKLMKSFPPNKKYSFVKEGLNVWFSKIIPAGIGILQENVEHSPTIAESLELLTEVLVKIDYTSNIHWMKILRGILNLTYPSLMRCMLDEQNPYWCKIWCMFVRLLKHQITSAVLSDQKNTSPINLLLSVVEVAFKSDRIDRCRAFECWNVLIDNLATESDEKLIFKRVKLLVIPLKSNNAKTEDVVLAKFNTWWHFLRRFNSRVEQFLEQMLVPFLQFCFGRPGLMTALIPGLAYPELTKHSIQAFIEICCGSQGGPENMPRLPRKILNATVLMAALKDWMYSLKVFIKILNSNECEIEGSKEKIERVWKSFVGLVAEVSEDNKKLLFPEFFTLTAEVEEDCDDFNSMETVFKMLLSLLDNEDIKMNILKNYSPEKTTSCLCRIIDQITIPTMQKLYPSGEEAASVDKLKPVANIICDENGSTQNEMIQWLLQNITPNDNTLMLWTALMESMRDIKVLKIKDKLIVEVLMWPLKNLEKFQNVCYSASVWNSTYEALRPRLIKTNIANDIFKLLMSNERHYKNHLVLCALLQAVKNIVRVKGTHHCQLEAEIIVKVLSVFDYNKNVEQFFPAIVSCIEEMVNYAKGSCEKTAKQIVTATAEALRLILEAGNIEHEFLTKKLLAKLHTVLMSVILFDINSCTTLKSLLTKNLEKCSKMFVQNEEIVNSTASILSILINNLAETTSKNDSNTARMETVTKTSKAQGNKSLKPIEGNANLPSKIEAIVSQKNNNLTKNESDLPSIIATGKKFTSPPVVILKKKKQPSIVKTVLVDGEEFAVVKSNWKFNPRNLTENQKEKFKRKREDIPALYQDLSQSQDEFRLSTWKPDSQDTSTSNSKTNSKSASEDLTSALSKMPNTDVFPKIMENIMSPKATKNKPVTTSNSKQTKTKPTTPKAKGPRVSLKDRVFQNVKNLIENSGLPEPSVLSNIIAKRESHDATTSPTTKIKKGTDEKLTLPDPPKTLIKRNKSEENPTKPSPSKEQSLPVPYVPVIDVALTLIQKSPLRETYVPLKDLNNSMTKDSVKTPTSKVKKDTGATNSAPPMISTDRPSRIKRKPRKYEIDFALATPNKKRRSARLNYDSQNEDSQDEMQEENEGSPELALQENDTAQIGPDSTENKVPCKKVVKNLSFANAILGAENSPRTATETVKSTLESRDMMKIYDSTNKSSANANCNVMILDEESESPQAKTVVSKCSTLVDIKTDSEQINKADGSESDGSISVNDVSKTDINSKPIAHEITLTPNTSEKLKQGKVTRKSRKSNMVASLVINMVEGNPFLTTDNKKPTRNSPVTKLRRKVVVEDTKAEDKTPKRGKKAKLNLRHCNETVEKSKTLVRADSMSTEDIAMSEDFIESSQDSNITTISVKSNRSNGKPSPRIDFELVGLAKSKNMPQSLSLLDDRPNKSLPENTVTNITADLDTEPMGTAPISQDVVFIPNDDEPAKAININDTQDIANADTEPMDNDNFAKIIVRNLTTPVITQQTNDKSENNESTVISETPNELTVTLQSTADLTLEKVEAAGVSSPFKDSEQRNQDFLNSTLEISPIKTMSPIPETKDAASPSENEFVVVTLSSPVQPNGEPFEKSFSPEMFTDDKVSPDKRKESPPREDIAAVNNSSPSSSGSFRNNRQNRQVRPGGRGAQMLGLCVSNRLQLDRTSEEKSDEAKKVITPAKKNLKILYNCSDNQDTGLDENEKEETFLKFQRIVPSAESSPSGPILKRKLADIADDSTSSPASKRKRVSFHDPPVSTTVSVSKYIEPLGIRSPQSVKRGAQQQGGCKMRKKLDCFFKLDSALANTLQDIYNITHSEETELSSLEPTLPIEIVRTDELNDKDPIYPELVNCKDPISNIATELSSPAMKSLLLKELEGKIETIGDLAKLTELEVNRICIKAPKIKVAKKVLADYAEKVLKESQDLGAIEQTFEAEVHCSESAFDKTVIEVQTDTLETSDILCQTDAKSLATVESQTTAIKTKSKSAQTTESGSKSTQDMVLECLREKTDYIDELKKNLDKTQKEKVCEDLPVVTLVEIINKKKISRSDIISSVCKMTENCSSKDIMKLISTLSKRAYDKS